MKEIISRKTEYRYTTSDPNRMLNKYLSKNVYHTWMEDFVDEDTNEVVSIERNELIFEKGSYIDQDTLAKIMFNIQSGDIKEVEISNQKRLAAEYTNTHMYPYFVNTRVNNKSLKMLVYGSSIANILEIVKDFIELNYSGGFLINGVKTYDSCIMIEDSLKSITDDSAVEEEEEKEAKEKKFYKLVVKIFEDESTDGYEQTFVVKSVDVDSSMLAIHDYLRKREISFAVKYIERGETYKIHNFRLGIEKVQPIPVSIIIPKEFSLIYNEKQ